MILRAHPYFFIPAGPRDAMARAIADRFAALIERRQMRGSISCALTYVAGAVTQSDLVAPLRDGSPHDKLKRKDVANSRQQTSVAHVATSDGEMGKKRKRRMPGTAPGKMLPIWTSQPKGPTTISAPRSRRR